MRKIIALVITLSLTTTEVAQAGFSLNITVGGNSSQAVDVTDINSVYSGYYLFNAQTGAYVGQQAMITLLSPLAANRLAVKVSVSDNAPGDYLQAYLFTLTSDIRSASGGFTGLQNVLITASDDFTQPTNGPLLLTSAFSTSRPANTTFTSNVLQGANPPLASINGNGTENFVAYGGYTLQNVTSIGSIGVNSNISTNGSSIVDAVAPAPAGLLLAGLGIPLFAGLRRFRKPRAKEVLAA